MGVSGLGLCWFMFCASTNGECIQLTSKQSSLLRVRPVVELCAGYEVSWTDRAESESERAIEFLRQELVTWMATDCIGFASCLIVTLDNV